MKFLHGRVVPQETLALDHKEQMFTLMDKVYNGCTREKFLADLSGKNSVLLLEDEQGTVWGFSTILVIQHVWKNAGGFNTGCIDDGGGSRARTNDEEPNGREPDKTVNILFSGDTVIDEAARGSLILMQSWWQDVVCPIAEQFPDHPLYWMLISKGWRTYKFCPLFFNRYFPSRKEETPPAMQNLIDTLGGSLFGSQYADGVITPDEPDYLKSGLEDISERRRQDPDVQFFLEKNPLFYQGNELVCLTCLHPDNLTKTGRRLVHPSRT